MTKEPKSKILILFIAILFLANVVTLYLLFNDKHRPRSHGDERKAYTASFLRDSVGFSDSQVVQYDSLSSRHRQSVKNIFEEMGNRRESTFKILAAENFSDSAIEANAVSLSAHQKDIELNLLNHIKDIRSLCTINQLAAFDAGFYKVIARRPDQKRDTKNKK